MSSNTPARAWSRVLSTLLVTPDSARTAQSIAVEKALLDLLAQHRVTDLTLAAWPLPPSIEPTSRTQRGPSHPSAITTVAAFYSRPPDRKSSNCNILINREFSI